MKLRLRENSIRLRLLQSEIKQIREKGFVRETIQFSPTQALTYIVSISETAEEISALFINDTITVKIPFGLALDWTKTEQVGLEQEQKVDENLTLKILLEKDFVCLERPSDADNMDTFPHPKMKC